LEAVAQVAEVGGCLSPGEVVRLVNGESKGFCFVLIVEDASRAREDALLDQVIELAAP
jgi:hypothetical protein